MIAVVYRPPDSPFHRGTQFLDVLAKAAANYSNKLILGDFNSNMCYLNHKSNLFYDFNFKNRLYLVPHGDTHIGPSKDSAIDLCIVDENDRILNFNKLLFINSHYLIQVTLDT